MATEKSAQVRLTTRQVQALFGVTHMSIYHWRKGTSTREPLKTLKPIKGEAPTAIRFDPKVVQRYADKYGITPVTTLDKVLAGKAKAKKRATAAPA